MGGAATGMLVVWTNVAAEGEADFNAWYTREHVADRVGVPGFRNGARYAALRGDPRYLALYETEAVDVLSSPAYLERLNQPTPWTQRVMPNFRDTIRAVCRIASSAGQGLGGVQRTYRVAPGPGQEGALRAALTADLPRRLAEQPGIVRVRVVEGVPPAATSRTAETAMRGADSSIAFGLLLDGETVERLEASGPLVDAALKRTPGLLAGGPEVGDYRLLYSFTR